MEPKRVLVCGDVEGNLKLLAKRSATFDLTLCIGELFTWRTNIPNLKTDFAAQLKLPIFKSPVYFIETGPLATTLCSLYPDGHEILPNLHFLGKFGIRKIQGFSIGYLSGTHNSHKEQITNVQEDEILSAAGFYSEKDIFELTNSLREDQSFKGIDFLMTGRWPMNFQKYQTIDFNVNGLKLVSLLAHYLKPRYHFVSHEDRYYQRQPYQNYFNVSHKLAH
jgi:hypothetical protein